MNKLLLLTLFLSFNSYADEHSLFKQQSKAAIKEFATTLKGKLVTAMKAGGPIEAITVCNQAAPKIAADLSEKYGMNIGRTSLKTRNPANNADEWEMAVLKQFEQLKQGGEPISSLVFSEAVTEDMNTEMRMMKAIPTGQVCLSCHGSNIAANIQQKIDELYPQDKAVGFKIGDIRGAFTVQQSAH
jgi:hypothetical protein